MTTLIKQKKNHASDQSSTEKTFNRLKKKIDTLRLSLKRTYGELDVAFQFYHEKILPVKNQLAENLSGCIKQMHEHYKHSPGFSKKEKRLLKEFIGFNINKLLSKVAYNDVDPEIRAIFNDIEGLDFNEIVVNELNKIKSSMQEMFEKEGIDIDLSHIDVHGDEQDIKFKIFEAMNEARERKMENDSTANNKQKTKRQLEKEIKIQELKNLEKKGLSTVYKNLAKKIHPDLEQDPVVKIEKEELMKRLTTAYDSKDLHALLTLEMEWMNRSNDKEVKTLQNKEQLKLYNSILKDQIKDLEGELEIAFTHPKYESIQDYLSEDSFLTLFKLEFVLNELESETKTYQTFSKKLLGRKAVQILREIL